MSTERSVRWSGESVSTLDCLLGEVGAKLPSFRRAPLTTDLRPLAKSRSWASALFNRVQPPPVGHRSLDAIIRLPDASISEEVPIALVSKRYSLIPHAGLTAAIIEALRTHFGDATTAMPCTMSLTEYGGRMHLRVLLPEQFTAPDKHNIRPTLECLNSVDRSRPLQVFLGWFRIVCSNGMVVGEALQNMKRRHIRSLELTDVSDAVTESVGRLTRESGLLKRWWNFPVNDGQLVSWIDGPLHQQWRVRAAARVLHIARTGRDGRLADSGPRTQALPPSRRLMMRGPDVPGSQPPNDNAYRLAQVLAFVAAERIEVEARQSRLLEIPGLIDHLTDPRRN
jgi:Domain of unknown function (DUF932)